MQNRKNEECGNLCGLSDWSKLLLGARGRSKAGQMSNVDVYYKEPSDWLWLVSCAQDRVGDTFTTKCRLIDNAGHMISIEMDR